MRGITRKRFQKEHLRRGIYVLPNIFTSMNIFCGFYAVIAAIKGDFVAAATSIIIAGVFDLLDGKIARATNTSSKFGVEYDSLADMVSFGMAPGIMMYLWTLKPLGKVGWLAAFLFTVCGALRLARFNAQADDTVSDHFVGLPIPAGAGINAAVILFCDKVNITPYSVVTLILVVALSFLMVSSVSYISLKKAELFKKMNFNVLVGIILVIIFIAAQHETAFFLIGFAYVFSGPVLAVRQLKNPIPDDEIDELESL